MENQKNKENKELRIVWQGEDNNIELSCSLGISSNDIDVAINKLLSLKKEKAKINKKVIFLENLPDFRGRVVHEKDSICEVIREDDKYYYINGSKITPDCTDGITKFQKGIKYDCWEFYENK